MIVFPHGFLTTQAEAPSEAFENTYSVEFDGSNDYVETGLSLTDLGITNKFTVSCWFYADTFTNFDGIFGAASAGNFNDGFGVYFMSTGVLRFFVGVYSQTANYVETTLSTGQWYHLLCCYDGSLGADNVKLYVDGVAIANGVNGDRTGNVPDSGGELRIATVNSSGSHYGFNGHADEFAVWNTDKRADVSTIYNSGSPASLTSLSPDLWYRMGDGANYPLIKNQAHFSQTAVEFDGSNDYVNLGNIHAFEYNNAFSLSCWVKHDYTTNRTYIAKIDNSPNTGQGYLLDTITGAKLRFWIANNYWGTKYMQVAGGTSITGGVWYHVVATYDGSGNRSGMKIYLNGSVETLTTAGATSLSDTMVSTEPLKIGVNDTSNYMAGSIDDISIYNAELSSSDVTDIYNSGYPKDESERSGLVGYWKMGDGDTYPTLTDNSTNSNDGTMTNMDSGDFVAAKGAGKMTNMASDDIVEDTP